MNISIHIGKSISIIRNAISTRPFLRRRVNCLTFNEESIAKSGKNVHIKGIGP